MAPLDHPSAIPAPNVTLPGDIKLFLKEGSSAYRLAMFLADKRNETVPQTFVFDHVSFVAGSPTLASDSEQTVDELRLILAAYPATDVQLHGYTDNAGDTSAGYKLALARAETIKLVLIKSGIAAPRLTTAGDRREYPLTFNNTENERGNNRRLEVVVLKK
jgi:outer membrane protein OmpA-like peptidoglycan-associated protein